MVGRLSNPKHATVLKVNHLLHVFLSGAFADLEILSDVVASQVSGRVAHDVTRLKVTTHTHGFESQSQPSRLPLMVFQRKE